MAEGGAGVSLKWFVIPWDRKRNSFLIYLPFLKALGASVIRPAAILSRQHFNKGGIATKSREWQEGLGDMSIGEGYSTVNAQQ